jgi:predicted  nucleic acid-binding Zn-ribbon protein
MPADPDAPSRPPRVCCEDCGHRWYGAVVAHGLTLIDGCPRCGGQLRFLLLEGETAAPDGEAVDAIAQAAALQPWQVLGVPSTWSGGM